MGAFLSGAQNIRTLEFSKGGNEPSIAVNPTNNAQVMLAYNNSNVFRSSDTGKTFKQVKVSSRYGFYGDPVVYWGYGKHFYLAHLAKNRNYAWPLSFDRIVFQKIRFNKHKVTKSTGIGWNTSNKLPPPFAPTPERPPHKMQDKPWFTVNRLPADPFSGRIHLAWTEFDNYGSKHPADSSRIRYAWSDNKGRTFSRPVTISRQSGDARDGDSTLEGATVCVDKLGNTYCLWSGLNQLWFTKSTDGGAHWTTPVVIGGHENGWQLDMEGIMRANGMPFLAALDDKLLTIWAANNTRTSEVFYKLYDVSSGIWSEARRIIIPAGENAFMPQVCTHGNKAYIAFYTSTRKGKTPEYELKIYTALIDGNQLSSKVEAKLLEGSAFMSVGKPFLGDYIGITALNQTGKDEALVAYTTLRDNRDTYISLARVKF